MDMQTKISQIPVDSPPVMPGAEPFFFSAGDTGCLLIHGFGGSPQGLRQMGEYLSKEGITALGVRLHAHGTRIEQMHSCRYQEWVASAEEGLQELRRRCSRIFLAGISMGGALSLRLARLHPGEISGVIAICTPYDVPAWMKVLLPPLKLVIKKINIGHRRSTKDPTVVEVNYPRISLPAAYELVKLLAQVRQDLPLITQPLLLLASRHDSVVHPKNAGLLHDALGSTVKEVVWLENSDHMATLDYDKELLFQRALAFMAG